MASKNADDKDVDEFTSWFLAVMKLLPKTDLPRERVAKAAKLTRNQVDLYISRKSVAKEARPALLEALSTEIAKLKEGIAAVEAGLAREKDAQHRRGAVPVPPRHPGKQSATHRRAASSPRRRGSS